MTRKIDIRTAPRTEGTLYPPPFDAPCRARRRTRIGAAGGLTQFGVNLCTLPPGAWSSQRHWHSHEDELIYVVSGEVTLVTNAGAEILRAGDSAAFRAGEPDGHCFQNRSDADVVLLEIGTEHGDDVATYPDIDLMAVSGPNPYVHRDGTPYPPQTRRT